MRLRNPSRRTVSLIGLAVLLLYGGWIFGPYLRSVIVRDAAVTTWVNAVAAPIPGYVGPHPLYPGDRVGPGGVILDVDNPYADPMPLARARSALARATARVAALEGLAATLRPLVEARTRSVATFGQTFRQDLDALLAGANENLLFTRKRLELERIDAGRKTGLAERGTATRAAADQATGRVTDYQKVLADIETAIQRDELRRRAADQGVFLLDDRTDAAVAERSLDELRVRLAQAEADLADARATAAAAAATVEAAAATYDRLRATRVTAPAGALMWSVMAAPGQAVQAGTPVALWLDCAVMLVDVPVSDVEVALLHKGDVADVVLEGEHRTRRGHILLVRGGAATLGRADLAALAKGRGPGTGQVLLTLEVSSADAEDCPVGHAAFVDFPEIGVVDVVLARLRL